MPNNVNIKTLVDDLGNIVVPITHVNAVFDNEGNTLPLMMDRKYPIDSKEDEEEGTALSLVTTGEKYIWNNKLSSSEKGANNGLATLDSTGKVPSSQLPAMDYIPTSLKGIASGVATLDALGLIPSSLLPSYVDDVIEAYYYGVEDPDTHEITYNMYSDSQHTTLITPESGKVYVDIPNNVTYRWSGSMYVVIGSDLTLGETSSTAYAGDKGKALADKLAGIENGAQAHKAPTTAEVKSALGTGSGTSKYLREDGTWLTPPDNNTTYSAGSGLSLSGTTFSLALTKALVTSALGYTPPTLDTNTWRPITNTYTGSDQSTSVSQYGTNALYNALVNGYASSAGNADTVDSLHFSYSNNDNNPTYLWGTNSNGSSFLAYRPYMSVNYANSAGSAPASDVYSWAKASSKPSYSYSEISGTPSIPSGNDICTYWDNIDLAGNITGIGRSSLRVIIGLLHNSGSAYLWLFESDGNIYRRLRGDWVNWHSWDKQY